MAARHAAPLLMHEWQQLVECCHLTAPPAQQQGGQVVGVTMNEPILHPGTLSRVTGPRGAGYHPLGP